MRQVFIFQPKKTNITAQFGVPRSKRRDRMLKNIQQVINLLGPERKLLPLLALLFVAMAVLEIISIGMIVPFLLVIFEANHSSTAEIQRFIPDFLNRLGLQEKSIILSLAMITLYASKNFLQLK